MTKESCKKYFEDVEDTRYEGFVDHKLWQVLTLVMCACMCGTSKLDEIVSYGKEKIEFLSQQFGIESIPSKPTLSRVLNMVNGEKIAQCVVCIMRDYIGTEGDIIAFDGKAIRQTYQDSRAEKVHIVSAFVTKTGVILGQKCIPEKKNEIPVVRDLLDLFDISGRIITADAMHCQRDTVEQIVNRGGDYVIGLKKNQRKFYNDVEHHFENADKSALEKDETNELNKGRNEQRLCFKTTDESLLSKYSNWKNLNAIYMVIRNTTEKSKLTSETSYYISSLDVEPSRMLEIVREHWKIEAMHNVLDVSFGEDEGRVLSKNGQITLNAFRKLSFAMHKNYIDETVATKTKPSIKSNMFKALLNDKIIPSILSVVKNVRNIL
jgi:predicted transposase YbfD/YdcC